MPVDGLPIVRPMWWLDPTNENLFNVSDQFIVGEDILVAPILDPVPSDSYTRNVYLPEGEWYNVDDECFLKGPVSIKQAVTLQNVPYYVTSPILKMLHLNKDNFGKCSFEKS